MKNIRYGFRLMWSEAPRLMRRYKIGKEGTFDTFNGHGGVCWGWPKECKLTNAQARAVYFACYNRRRLTVAQMTRIPQTVQSHAATVPPRNLTSDHSCSADQPFLKACLRSSG